MTMARPRVWRGIAGPRRLPSDRDTNRYKAERPSAAAAGSSSYHPCLPCFASRTGTCLTRGHHDRLMFPTSLASQVKHRLLASFALCVLGVAAAVPSAFGREGAGFHAPRFAMSRGAQAEARGARPAERAQQKAARPNQPREAPAQRTSEPPMQPVSPPSQPADAAAQGGKPGRLTPDERRALRQQINEAGRDVYRPNRP